MRPAIQVLTALFFGVVLSSCSAAQGDCDPTTGGFVGAIRCDTSGSYNARLKQREDQHAALISRRATLIREQQQVEAEQRQLAAQLKSKHAQDKEAQSDLAAIQRQLAGTKTEDAVLRQRASTLESGIAKNKTEIEQLSLVEQSQRARLEELRKEKAALDAEYRASVGGR